VEDGEGVPVYLLDHSPTIDDRADIEGPGSELVVADDEIVECLWHEQTSC